jgi:hypothetical protein
MLQENKKLNQHLFKIHYDKYLKDINLSKEEFQHYSSEIVDFMMNPSQQEWESVRIKNPELLPVEGLSFPKNKNYVFSQKAMAIASSIKLDLDKFDPVIISSLTEGKMCTFLCGKNLTFRYWFKNKQLLGMILEFNEQTGMVNYVNFRLRASDSSYYFPEDNHSTAHWKSTYFVQFLKLLFFLEFSEVEYRLLGPNQKYGTKKEGKFLNETRGNITIVNSNWNIITINNNGFTVCGHLRMQPVGKDRMGRKLIFIEEFEKGKITRRGQGTEGVTDKEINNHEYID